MANIHYQKLGQSNEEMAAVFDGPSCFPGAVRKRTKLRGSGLTRSQQPIKRNIYGPMAGPRLS